MSSTVCTSASPAGQHSSHSSLNPWHPFPALANLAISFKKSVTSAGKSKKNSMTKVKSSTLVIQTEASSILTSATDGSISDKRKRSQSLTNNGALKVNSVDNKSISGNSNGSEEVLSIKSTGQKREASSASLVSKNSQVSSPSTGQMQKTPSQGNDSRRNSGTEKAILTNLARTRVVYCIKKNCPPKFGHLIWRRICNSSRSEIRNFVKSLSETQVNTLSYGLFDFIVQCVDSIDDTDNIVRISKEYGETYVQYVSFGFRPEYFLLIADNVIGSCTNLDSGTHKSATLLAFSKFFEIIFGEIRNGYYAQLRQLRNQRRAKAVDTTEYPNDEEVDGIEEENDVGALDEDDTREELTHAQKLVVKEKRLRQERVFAN
uniref:MIF4G domain-containing protein n=1 Tax=Rhabditophanes sp. KR3021 TaxID=114890 RepID=A0AC35UBH5_9BILA